jgi:ADP-heptose:LPS heptosyltransferase
VESPPLPRLRRAELHIGEQLSLLVRLLADRTRPVYDALGTRVVPPEDTNPLDLGSIPSNVKRIVISPVGNSDLRNWPLAKYAALVLELLQRLDCVILLTGARSQSGEIAAIVRDSGNPERVIDLAGRTAWTDMPDLLRRADLVICNNSGVAHLAAACGVRTLAIYSASHQPQEWGPRGALARAIMAVVPCSPCGYDRLADCPNDHACMHFIRPEMVAQLAIDFLSDPDGRQALTAGIPSAGAIAAP